jgi:hypothetical protein
MGGGQINEPSIGLGCAAVDNYRRAEAIPISYHLARLNKKES